MSQALSKYSIPQFLLITTPFSPLLPCTFQVNGEAEVASHGSCGAAQESRAVCTQDLESLGSALPLC